MQTSSLINNLFKEFHNHKIIYCHWKSNEHLDASFKGETDFDVLFDRKQKTKVEEIFKSNGFSLFTAPYNRRYDNIVDYIGIDSELNKMIHFHTHYHLETGTSGLKEYRYAIEDKILSKRIFNQEYGCYIIDPRFEFILLIIRLSLKIKNNWKADFQLNKEVINSNRELRWLKERVTLEELLNFIDKLQIPYEKEIIKRIYNNEFEYETLNSLSLNKNNIKDLIKASYTRRKISRWSKWLYFQYGRVLRKTQLSYIVKNRVKHNNGFSIALIGSDGSGKSTQMMELKRIFSTKIDVESFYLGSNKGSRSVFRRYLDFIENNNLYFNLRPLERLVNLFFALTIGIEKNIRLNKALKLKNKGVLVLFDRFPQIENYGFNDGPLLLKALNSRNIIYNSIGKLERKLYSISINKCPNIIIKLIAEPSVLAKRRNMTVKEVESKQNSIKDLNFGGEIPIIHINANKSINEVTSEILIIIQERWLNENN